MRRSRLSIGPAILMAAFSLALIAVACGGKEEVIREVEVEKIVEKEVVKEVVKEVPITKEVVKEVPVVRTVVATPTAGPVMAKEGTIPGSVLTVALETVGKLTTEPAAGIPLYGCRPGCLPIKDDLLLMDRVGNLLPHVVREWDFGPDTTSWTIKMQQGIKFFNGRTANIEDLEFSIFEGARTRPCGIPSPYCSEERDPKDGFVFYNSFYNASTHEIVDDETIKIEFDNPTIGLGQMDLTTNRGQSGIFPMQEIKAVGWEEWLKDPILSGPYRQTKSVPGERKEFEVNVDWWKKPAPDFEKQILMQVPEAATRLAMVASKQADVMTLSALTLNQALQLPHVKILQQPATIHMQFYFFNMLNQDDKGYDPDNPFYDVRVREAFNIAVNREALVNTIYAGLSEVQNAPMMATGMRGWDHPIVVEMRNNPIPFDPSRARQLLKEAGFPKDRKVRILASTSSASGAPEIKELTEAVFTMLRQNLDLDIELVLSASVGEERKLQRYEEDKPSMPWDLAAFFRNSTEPIITPRASYLYSRSMSMFLTDPTWSQMLEIDEVLTSTSEPAVFDEASAKMSKLVRDCWCMIPFTLNPLFWAVNKDRVEDWPLTVGAPWPHYFEYIKAAPQVRQ